MYSDCCLVSLAFSVIDLVYLVSWVCYQFSQFLLICGYCFSTAFLKDDLLGRRFFITFHFSFCSLNMSSHYLLTFVILDGKSFFNLLGPLCMWWVMSLAALYISSCLFHFTSWLRCVWDLLHLFYLEFVELGYVDSYFRYLLKKRKWYHVSTKRFVQ